MSDGRAQLSSEQRGKRPTILLVEDEVLIRLLIAEQLRDAGYLIIEAANADEAVKVLSSRLDIDCVISDIRMPGSMDGLGLAAFIRSEHPTIKVVLASGHFQGKGESMEYDGFFPKPYDVVRLLKHVNGFVTMDNR